MNTNEKKEDDSQESSDGNNISQIQEMTLEIYEPHPMTIDITPIEDEHDAEEASFYVEWEGGTQTYTASQITDLQNIVPLTRGELMDDNGYFEYANSFVEVGNIIAEWFNLPPL